MNRPQSGHFIQITDISVSQHWFCHQLGMTTENDKNDIFLSEPSPEDYKRSIMNEKFNLCRTWIDYLNG